MRAQYFARFFAATFAGAALATPGMAVSAEYDCLIEPFVVVNASTALEGVLETVKVGKGDVVERGQIVATLESTVEAASVEYAAERVSMDASLKARQARLDFSRKKQRRADKLKAKKYISPDEVDEFESAVIVAVQELEAEREAKQLARLELKRVQAQLLMRTIRSPITGVVVQRFLSPGEFAQAQPILRLAQLDPLHVEVVLPVSAFGTVEVGELATVAPGAPVGGEYKATVRVVDQVIDAASGTFGVRLELPNPELKLPAGLECRVRFSGSAVKNTNG
ncbi:MAG: RND family efflux transporter MFP subunit [Gammaproteobacteria bacterium]|jgi:RND family efflux transporter MFP subunit